MELSGTLVLQHRRPWLYRVLNFLIQGDVDTIGTIKHDYKSIVGVNEASRIIMEVTCSNWE